MLGRDPARAIELDLEDGFPRFMDEYRAESGEPYVPFTHLVTVAQTVGEDVDAAAEMLRRGGYGEAARGHGEAGARPPLRPQLGRGVGARSRCGSGCSIRRESREAAAGLDDEQRAYLREVSEKLGPEMDGEAVQDVLYSTAIGRGLKPKRAFAAVYTVLLGKTSGPKAGPFIAGLDPWSGHAKGSPCKTGHRSVAAAAVSSRGALRKAMVSAVTHEA